MFRKRSRSKSHPARRLHTVLGRPLRLERLEDRCLLTTWNVTSAADDGSAGTLRYAIASASAGDIVTFASSISQIDVTGGYLDITKSLAIQGPGDANPLTINGQNNEKPGYYMDGVFEVGQGVVASISGLTIADGLVGGPGGGVDNSGNLTLNDCLFSGNNGCVYESGSAPSLTATNCRFIANESFTGGYGGAGGGVMGDGVLNVTNCVFSGNAGYAILFSGTTATVAGSTLTSNTYGAISNTGVVTIVGSTLSGNGNTSVDGGGVLNGGIYGSASAGVTIINCTICGNIAGEGGGIYNNEGSVAVYDSTIASNSAAGGGGGIYAYSTALYPGSVTLENTIVAANPSLAAPDLYGNVAASYCLIGNNAGSQLSNGGGSLIGTGNSPINPLLGNLANNGGLTQTMALLSGSPAISSGCVALIPACVTTDERGTGYARKFGNTVDIGAYEHQAPFTPNTWQWTGAAGGNRCFGCSVNWQLFGNTGNGTPINGDSLVFDTVGLAADNAPWNDLANLTLGGITFNSGAGSYNIGGNALTLTGNGLADTSGNNTLNLDLIVGNTAQTFNVAGGCQVSLAGGVAFNQPVSLIGSGAVILSGGDGGSGCQVTVSNGTLQLGNANTDGSLAGSILDNAALVIDNGGGPQTLTNLITGNGTLTAAGPANNVLTIAGNQGYLGLTTVNSGAVLKITGNLAGAAAVNGQLGGSGCIAGNVTVNGTLAPSLGSGNTTLTLGGSLSFNASSTLAVVGNATASDQVNVLGNVTLAGNVTLQLTETGALAGTTYKLLNPAAGKSISGTFTSSGGTLIQQSGLVPLSGTVFDYNYACGTNNNSLWLTAASNNTWVWTGGGGANQSFSNSLNWQLSGGGNGAPASGDSLVFNSQGLGSNSPLNNDVGLSVTAISFNSGNSGYTLGGNSITLAASAGGLTDQSGNQTIALIVITANNTEPVNVAAGCQVQLTRGVSFGSPMTLDGAGTLIIDGSDTGSGCQVTVSAGTLQLGNGASNGSVNGNVADNASVVFDTASDESCATTVTGSGNLVKAGSGNLTLSQSSFGGAITISGGGLVVPANLTVAGGVLDDALLTVYGCLSGGVAAIGSGDYMSGNGTVLSNVSVANGGTLGGNLTLAGANLTVAAGGAVDPGVGNAGCLTLSTTNAPMFAAGSIINMQVGGNVAGVSYDQLNITDGATVNVAGVVLNVTSIGNYLPTAPSGNTIGDHLVLINDGGNGALAGSMVAANAAGPGNVTLNNGAGLAVGSANMRLFYNDSTLGASQDLILAQMPALANVTYNTATFATYNGSNDGENGLQASVISSLAVTFNGVVDTANIVVQHITAGTGGAGSTDHTVNTYVVSQSVVGEQTVIVIGFLADGYVVRPAIAPTTVTYQRGNNGGQYTLNNGWYQVDTLSVGGTFSGSAGATVAPTAPVDTFWRLYGDYAHTGVVSATDLSILNSVNNNNAYVANQMDGTYPPVMTFLDACDFWGNGVVNKIGGSSSTYNLDMTPLEYDLLHTSSSKNL